MTAVIRDIRPSPTFTPYDHQREAVEAVMTALRRGQREQLVVMPTGTGKTKTAALLSCYFARVLFLVHTRELLEQARDSFAEGLGEHVGVIGAGHDDPTGRVNIATIQTLHKRLDRLEPNMADLVVLDEAHHGPSKTFADVLGHLRPRLRLGLSATPERSDKAPLAALFGDITYQLDVADAIRRGLIVRPDGRRIHTDVQLDDVQTSGGDFNNRSLADTVNTPHRNDIVARGYLDYGEGRIALGFSVDIAHARALAETFQTYGVRADWTSGADPEQADKLRRFKAGEIAVLFSANLLTEGFDYPAASCALMARPTKSRVLFTQMVGRVLRRYPGKHDARVLHYSDATTRHSLVDMWDIYGDEEKAQRPNGAGEQDEARALAAAFGVATPEQVGLILSAVGGDVDVDVWASVVDHLAPKPPVSIEPFIKGARRAEAATPAQLARLARSGVDVDGQFWTAGDADDYIAQLPPTPAQRARLLALGYNPADDWTAKEASRVLNTDNRTPDYSIVKRLKKRKV